MIESGLKIFQEPVQTGRKIKKHARHLISEPHRIRAYFFYLSHPAYPLFTPAATRFLAKWLAPGMQVFEWGAGRSTLFFERHGANLVTVEHDPLWHEKISRALPKKSAASIELKLIKPDQASSDASLEDPRFTNYVKAIMKYPDNYFDLVVVDGRERSACLLASLPTVKPGGLVMLDDSQRERYRPAKDVVNKLGWLPTPFPYGFNETTVWKNPPLF